MAFPNFRALRELAASEKGLLELLNREVTPVLKQVRDWLQAIGTGAVLNYVWYVTTDANGDLTPTWGSAAGLVLRPPKYIDDTTYTLEAEDVNYTLVTTSNSDTEITVPPESEVAFTSGVDIQVHQQGEGQLIFLEGTGVQVDPSEKLRLRTQYASGMLRYLEDDRWFLSGDVELT